VVRSWRTMLMGVTVTRDGCLPWLRCPGMVRIQRRWLPLLAVTGRGYGYRQRSAGLLRQRLSSLDVQLFMLSHLRLDVHQPHLV
jgi:hypothetical protein